MAEEAVPENQTQEEIQKESNQEETKHQMENIEEKKLQFEDMILLFNDKEFLAAIGNYFMGSKINCKRGLLLNKEILNSLSEDLKEIGISRAAASVERIKFIGNFSMFLTTTGLIFTFLFEHFLIIDLTTVILISGLLLVSMLLGVLFINERNSLQKLVYFKKLLEQSKK